MKHDWIPSTLGHGETMCRNCKATNREVAVLGMDDCSAPEAEASEPQPEYAVVELMGYVRHVGRLTEVERFGTKMGRIDIPKGGKFEDGFTSVFFSGGSIYRVTPCDLATVERANRPYEPAGRLTYHEPDTDEDEAPEDLELKDEPTF